MRRAGSFLPAVWQPGQPVFWVMAVGVLACTPLQWRALAAEQASALLVGAATLALLVQLGAFWVAAGLLLRARRRPVSMRFAAVAWGFAVVPVVAAFANGRYFGMLNALGLHSFAASIAAPIDEDALRLLGVLGVLTLVRHRRVSMLDGTLYGFLVGAGFEVAENLSFVLGSGDLELGLRTALVRTGVGFGLHALWTGIAGAALAGALSRREAKEPARWGLVALGVLGPMLLHACWDAPALSLDPSAITAVLVAVYAATLALFVSIATIGIRRERAA